MNTIKNIVRKYWKIVVAYIASLYGVTFTTFLGCGIILDEVWATERLECAVMMTCVPAMIWGVRTLKEYWIAKALSKAKEDTELTLATAA